MGLITAAGVAFAAWCAVVAMGTASITGLDVGPAPYAVALLPGLVLAARREPRPYLQSVLVRLAGWGLTSSLFVLYALLSGEVSRHLDTVARAMPFAVLALSALWPSPTALVPSVFLAAASLLGSDVSAMDRPWPVAGVVAGIVAALVAMPRLHRRSPTFTPHAAPPHRRLARDAAAAAAVVALAGLAAAALLPPATGRDSAEGDRPPSGGDRGGAASRSPLTPGEQLDLGDGRAGAGPGGSAGDEVVLRVAAARPDLWRAQTFDRWDGRAWHRSADGREPASVDASGTVTVAPPVAGFGAYSGHVVLAQRVTVAAPLATVLVGATDPFMMQVPPGGFGWR